VGYVLLLELPSAGLFARFRRTGSLVGIKEVLPDIDNSKVLFLNGLGHYDPSGGPCASISAAVAPAGLW